MYYEEGMYLSPMKATGDKPTATTHSDGALGFLTHQGQGCLLSVLFNMLVYVRVAAIRQGSEQVLQVGTPAIVFIFAPRDLIHIKS